MRSKLATLAVLVAIGLVAVAGIRVAGNAISAVPPEIISITPAPGSTNIPNVRLQVAFDSPVNPDVLDLDVSIRRSDEVTERIAGAIEFSESRTAAIFRPYRRLPAGNVEVSVATDGKTSQRWNFDVKSKKPLYGGAGGPILLVLSEAAPFAQFYAEILRAEGYTSFDAVLESDLPARRLDEYRLIIVPAQLPGQSVAKIQEWVRQGGNLIAVQPTGDMARFAGVENLGALQRDGYIRIDTRHAPGEGLVAEPIQFHGPADRYRLDPGTKSMATLGNDGSGEGSPALAVRDIGTAGGQVASFAFDLAQSIVLTRQGNPDWAGQDRDGLEPIRPNDLFYGNAENDPQPDYLDLDKLAIPQADEQMRLLSNLIRFLQRDSAPIPKFWYFPKRIKAVLVMAADDHGTEYGTQSSFDRMLKSDDANCQVAKWECARATSWLLLPAGLTSASAKSFAGKGFDFGSHVSTYCKNWSQNSLDAAFATDLLKFRSAFPQMPAQQGSRLHCIVWSDFTAQAEIGRDWGIRYDMNYYYWPKTWVQGRAGFMTGSGIPMRFSSEKGELINVYQQETHLVDEVFFEYPDAIEGLFKRALGPEGYFGAFGTHYDFHNAFDQMLVTLAKKYAVPMVSVQQMLDWQDGRNESAFANQRWDGENLRFALNEDTRTGGMLTAMLPLTTATARLDALYLNGEPVAFSTETIKGVEYALFPGIRGEYRAYYQGAVQALE